jgi:hypothetical protein
VDGDNYEKVYASLWQRVTELDLPRAAVPLGGRDLGDGTVEIDVLEQPLRVSREGVRDRRGRTPHSAVRIVLCHYLLRGGRGALSNEWTAYRELEASAFFMANFKENVERHVSRTFAGRPEALERAVLRIGGKRATGEASSDGAWTLSALPRVPLLLLFNDRDEEFPADARLLFDRSADVWLDAECLAVVGWIVAERLCEAA